jgi:hypothetical protein
MSGAPPTRARSARIALVVLVIAVAVRLAIVFTTDRVAPSSENDEGQYFSLALNLVEGRGMSVGQPPQPTAVRTPGYPVALAASFALAGPSLRAGLVVGAMADGITAALVALLAMRLVPSPARGFAAGFAWALLSPYLWWMDYLYPDPLGATLVTAALLAALAADARARAGAWAGVSWAAAVLTRPFLLVAAVGSLIAMRRRAALVGLLGFALAALPWTIRNAAVFHRLIPLSTGGTGMNLWVGTWNDSRYPVVQVFQTKGGPVSRFSGPYFDSEDERVRAEAAWNAYMDELLDQGSPAIVGPDATLRGIALERIRRHPGRWIMLRLRNALLAWTLPDVPRGRWVGVPLLALALAGAAGLAHSGRRRELLLVGAPLLLLAATLFPLRTEARYVAGMAPLLFALAATAFWRSNVMHLSRCKPGEPAPETEVSQGESPHA